jgi:hypothetical protein
MSLQIMAPQRPSQPHPEPRHEIGRGVLLFALMLLLAGVMQRASSPQPARPPRGAGVVALAWPTAEQLDRFGSAWYYTYGFLGATPAQHERVYLAPVDYDEQALARTLAEHPGSWWMVGNEPNDPHQDHLSPGAYAAFYHRFDELARRVDPTSRVMPAGIANADWGWAHDFRERYRYQYGRYPRVDAWNIHNYILEPEHEPWALDEFQRRIFVFRDWMSRVGEGGKPLVLSEFGVLQRTLPDGTPIPPERVLAFMEDSVRWMASSGAVDSWAWFATYGGGQFGGELTDAKGALTAYGEVYRALAQEVAP